MRTPHAWHSTTSQVLNPSDSAHLLQQQSLASLLKLTTEASSYPACTLLAGLQQPKPILGEQGQKLNYRALINALLYGCIRLHSLQESLGSDRETIETHSLPSQTPVSTLKSHAQCIQSKCMTRKHTFKST
jgi:hypothetical protein